MSDDAPPSAPAWRRHGSLILTVACAAVFLGGTLAWEASSAYPAVWGDSGPNAIQVVTVTHYLDDFPLLKMLIGADPMEHKLRAPLHHLLAGAWLAIFGQHHLALVLFQSLMLLGAALLLRATVLRETGAPTAGLVVMALFLTAPETIIQAHCFFLEVSTVLWGALALWALRPALEGSRWGPALLGLALGAGLLSRHHSAVAVAVPVGLCALPALFGGLRRAPVKMIALGLALPLLAVLGSLGSAWLTREAMGWHDAPGAEGFSTNLSLLLLTAVAGVALVRLRPRGDDLAAERGLNMALALGLAIAMALPWYLTFFGHVHLHFGESSGPELLSASAAPTMIAFEYLCLALRLLSPLGFLLLWPGIVAALRRRALTTTLCVVALLVANIAFPMYFHARYNFVLLIFALPLVVGWLSTLKLQARRPLYIALLLLGLVRFAGWATPLPLAPLDVDEFRNESITWHSPDDELFWPSVAMWFDPRLTIAPMPHPDLIGVVFSDVEKLCDRDRCQVLVHEIPFDFRPYQVVQDREVVEYYTTLHRRHGKAEWADRAPEDSTFHLLMVATSPPTVADAEKAFPGRPISRQKVYLKFGSMPGSLFEVKAE